MKNKNYTTYGENIIHMKYHVKKITDYEEFYLSPHKRRWLSIHSKKHRFGKFTKDECIQFISQKVKLDSKGKYEIVPAE